MDDKKTQEKSDEQPPNRPADDVLSKSITGGKWLTIGYIAQRAIGLISFVILARLLDPKDFGVMAIVLLIPKFLQTTTETGLTAAIIQRGGAVERFLNPIWTVGIIKSTAIMILIFFGGPIIADFLNAPDAVLAIRLGGIFIFIQNLANIGELFFFKNLDFKKIFLRNTAKEIAYVVAAVVSVYFFRSYWALMIATAASYVTQMISTYLLHPYRPRVSLEWSSLRQLVGYSKWIVGQGWLSQIFSAIEQGTVARFTGISQTGLYTKAKSLAAVAPGFLSSVVAMVSFPAYSIIKDSPSKIKLGITKSMHLISFFTIPVGFLIMIAGGKLILIALGHQWLPMFTTMRLLFIHFALNLFFEISYAVFNAVGIPQKKFQFEAVRITISALLLLALTMRYGIEGTALAMLSGTALVIFFVLRWLRQLTRITFTDILATMSVPFLASVIITVPLLLFKTALSASPLLFSAVTAACGIAYLLLIYAAHAFWKKGPYSTLTLILQKVL